MLGGEEDAVGGGERGDRKEEGLEEKSKEEERKIGELEARFKLRELKLLAQVESRFQTGILGASTSGHSGDLSTMSSHSVGSGGSTATSGVPTTAPPLTSLSISSDNSSSAVTSTFTCGSFSMGL